MAKRKKQPPEPVKQPGVPLPLDYPEIPDSWMPVDDFSSHRPMLYRAIMNTAHNAFFEFGTGKGSTPLLRELYAHEPFKMNDLISYESDYQWYDIMKAAEYEDMLHADNIARHKNHTLFYEPDLLQPNIWRGSILFIDCAPAELRKFLISKHSNIAKLIIVHDTEPEAEYIYGTADILNSFRHRCDLLVEGVAQTTVVSNLYEFENWKTVINDQIKFI